VIIAESNPATRALLPSKDSILLFLLLHIRIFVFPFFPLFFRERNFTITSAPYGIPPGLPLTSPSPRRFLPIFSMSCFTDERVSLLRRTPTCTVFFSLFMALTERFFLMCAISQGGMVSPLPLVFLLVFSYDCLVVSCA